MRRFGIGVDFGGTVTKLGLVDEAGAIVRLETFSTEDAAQPDAWIRVVAETVESLVKGDVPAEGKVAGLGVGAPGFVDYEHGVILELPNVPGWTSVRIGERLKEATGYPACVDNDVNVMAVGEGAFGAGRTLQHAVFVTLGTGVGGALMINNRLYRGAYGMAGEIGHMSIDWQGVETSQGRGGVETYVGNKQISRRTKEAIAGGRTSRISELVGGDLEAITPKVVAEAAREGDALALEIFDYVAECLAAAFASATYLIQPQAIIVGGGVSQSGPVLFDPLRKHLDRRLSPVFAERIEVRAAELGNDAGVIGGATEALMGS